MLILGLNKGCCTFVTSDFPAENPRSQNRNYSYTITLCNIKPNLVKTKFFIVIILFLIASNAQSQSDYFKGKHLYCESENPEAIRLFNIGIETLHLNTSLNKKFLKKTSDVFFRAYQTDTTFCDAMFFTGYTLRLLNDKNALVCYYMADSLSNNKSIEFKMNLATESLRFGNDEGVKIARKKYNEITEFFPENPEGYYGIALTSTMVGDIENGLNNINIAIEKYKSENIDAIFLKAVLLTLNARHEESLNYYEKVKGHFKKDDNFNGNFALSLYEVAKTNNDEKMMKLAKKHYKKVKNKNELTEQMRGKFEK